MKTIIIQIIFIFILVTQNTFAITGKDNWRDIRASSDLMIQQPTFAGLFGQHGLFNACTTDDEFKSMTPVKICLDYRCAYYEIRPVSMSRTYVKNVCVRHAPTTGECLDYATVTAVYPTSFSFAVIEINGSEYGDYLFSKTFALKTCE